MEMGTATEITMAMATTITAPTTKTTTSAVGPEMEEETPIATTTIAPQATAMSPSTQPRTKT
eukprot:11276855-Ditylum_brightwellii.AAC.1